MKLIRTLGLMAVLATTAGLTAATAQDTKQKEAAKKDDAKKDDTKKKMPGKTDDKKADAKKAGTFEVYTDNGGKFRFRIKAADGKQLAMSHIGYPAKEDALKAIDAIKAMAADAKTVEEKEEK